MIHLILLITSHLLCAQSHEKDTVILASGRLLYCALESELHSEKAKFVINQNKALVSFFPQVDIQYPIDDSRIPLIERLKSRLYQKGRALCDKRLILEPITT